MPQVILNPRKKFKFEVIIPNAYEIEIFGAQEVTLPDQEVEQVEHGVGVTAVKTGGLVKKGNLTINRIMSAGAGTPSGKKFVEWGLEVQNANTQVGGDPDQYGKTIIINELSNDNIIIDTHTYTGCWPTRINGRELSRVQSENTVESVEFSVDYVDET